MLLEELHDLDEGWRDKLVSSVLVASMIALGLTVVQADREAKSLKTEISSIPEPQKSLVLSPLERYKKALNAWSMKQTTNDPTAGVALEEVETAKKALDAAIEKAKKSK